MDTISQAALALTLTLAIAGPPAAAAEPANQRTWISDVTIVSPEKLDRIEKGNVLIEDGRIARVDRGGHSDKPADATEISGKGKYLIPGLIDSHVHLASIPGVAEPSQMKPEIAKAYYEQLPRSYLYYGYTTLVDLVVVNHKVLDDFRKAPLHPDLLDCGEPLVFSNGYPMNFAPPGVRFEPFPNFIYDTKHPEGIPSKYKAEDHTPEADVARVSKSGAVCVKTFIERGFAADTNLPIPGADILARIRKASADANLLMMVHANSFETQTLAVDANADIIVHGMWNWNALEKSPQVPPEIKALLDRIIEKKIGYQSTIQVIGGANAYFDPGYLKSPEILKVIPASMLEWFRTPEGQWFKKELAQPGTSDAKMFELIERGPVRRVQQATAYLASHNANLLFGTDTPSGPTYGNLPGWNGYLEMRQLNKAGLSLEQIFRAATISNAREFKIDSQVGTIEAGKVANLVLLDKSPLESVDAYDGVVRIWIRGQSVPREELAAGPGQPARPGAR